MENVLYEWQEKCIRRWLANHGRGIVQAATGSGKTLLALAAIKHLKQSYSQELRVKIVVPSGAIMRQWNKALREFLADSDEKEPRPEIIRNEIGLRGCGFRDPADRRYMVYVINSARYELARQILSELRQGKKIFLIADECHHYASGQNQLIFEFLPYIRQYESSYFSLGLTATLPSGQALKYLSDVLGQKIYSYSVKKALAMQTVCPYDIYHISVPFQDEERDEYMKLTNQIGLSYRKLLKMCPFLKEMYPKDRFEQIRTLAGGKDKKTAKLAAFYLNLSYKRKKLVNLASARYTCALDLIKRLDENEKIIIFGERISQAEELYNLLQIQYPGKTGRYHSQMGAQANYNTLERFQNGDIRILAACKSVDEGVNVPDASIGIILSGTSVRRQRVQRLGRLIRKKDGKSRASLYYLHIEETMEDVCFLPDTDENRLFELEYLPDSHNFLNPPYDTAASGLLEDMRRGGMEEEKLAEILRCLDAGSVRADWTLDEAELSARIKSADSTRDRNYWICMKRLHRQPT